jgi:hypothetical protein
LKYVTNEGSLSADSNCRWNRRNGIVCCFVILAVLAQHAAFSTITYDTLVRAGISCTSAYVASATDNEAPSTRLFACKGSRGIRILPDASFPQTKFSSGVGYSELESARYVAELCIQDKYDILVVPGGAQGAATISNSAPVQDLVREFIKDDKIVGMICAGTSPENRRLILYGLLIPVCDGQEA